MARLTPSEMDHLEGRSSRVLTGDIGEPNLGLAEATWERLAGTVDLIAHAAAFVNHVLPCGQLFGLNVVGTAEVIRLAIEAHDLCELPVWTGSLKAATRAIASATTSNGLPVSKPRSRLYPKSIGNIAFCRCLTPTTNLKTTSRRCRSHQGIPRRSSRHQNRC